MLALKEGCHFGPILNIRVTQTNLIQTSREKAADMLVQGFRSPMVQLRHYYGKNIKSTMLVGADNFDKYRKVTLLAQGNSSTL